MKLKVNAQSLPKLQMVGMVGLVLLFTLLLGGYFLYEQSQHRDFQLETLKKEILLQQEALLESELNASVSYTHYMRTRTEEILKRESKVHVDQAIAIAQSIYDQQKGRIPNSEIKALIREALRDIRFFAGRGYLFIDDLDGLCILLPTAPHIEGRSLLNNKDDTGHYIMRGLIEAVSNPEQAGFSRYRWYAPGDNKVMRDKIAYVRLFEPFQWIIGAGDYLYQIENDLKAETLRRLERFRFGDNGYVAVVDFNGQVLVNPILSSIPDTALKQTLRQKSIELILEKAKSGGGAISYDWFYPDGRGPVIKRALVKVVPEWEWVLVAGLYPDDLTPLLDRHRDTLDQQWVRSLKTLLLVLSLSSISALILALIFSGWLKSLFRRYQADIDRQQAELTDNAQALELAAQVFQSATEGIVISDPHNHILAVNPAFTEITGYTEAEAIGRDPSFMASGNHSDLFYASMWQALSEKGHWQGEVWNRRKDGVLFPEWLSISMVKKEDGQVKNYVATLSDISVRKENEERLRYLAEYDSLTDLPNRRLLAERTTQMLHVAEHNRQQLALLFVDLDRFKNVNDSLGHDIGDQLLCEVAKRLTRAVRGNDTVSRVGGDEFVILCPEITQPEQAAAIASRILTDIAMSIELQSHLLTVTPSIGIAFYPQDGENFETLYRNADAALYHAKNQGRDQYQFFTHEMNVAVSERLSMENALRQGILRDELKLAYQPQYCIETGRLRGVEALVRWQHPEKGLIGPDQFIPLAEESGLIIALGEWVLREACYQGQHWLRQGYPAIEIAVNVSALQFREGLVSMVSRVLTETEFPPQNLVLEMTESTLMSDANWAIETLDELKALGAWISLDDFGTGYSSLAYLKRFPLDKLKIDRAFVRDLPDDAEDVAITSAIISLARSLNLLTVAEGIETPEQLAFLKQQGCQLAQGFLLDRPLWGQDVEQRLQQAMPD